MYPYYEAISTKEHYDFNILFEEDFSFPPHLHSHMELVFVAEGEMCFSVNDSRKNLKKGDIAVCFPNDVHSYSSTAHSKLLILIFSPEIIREYFKKHVGRTLENPFIEGVCSHEAVGTLLDMLVEESSSHRNEFVIKGILYSILGKLEQNFIFKDGRQLHDTTIQKLLRYIGSHFSESITLESVARDLGFSRFHISRIFNGKIGEQFNEYVNKLRINMAQSLLAGTDASVSNIALECGFESIRNFNRVFKIHSGMTPNEYRQNRKK
ncbi:HTH-type transcriptional activator RhaR [Ruminiclostridium hungatei]|uniref:HTH-type transcriptional activator RhaR n=1 Tax=Ruminiclostridium hungatei TaxID=48256 RepID=A0A1V4SNI1_RUMHU|nr:AraC family transcriptional regulator [Ruminiclostridium hungatei]OPX45025.1 HTH-type transcriptional activator RhaR [Ruminiclostridium hungatei]